MSPELPKTADEFVALTPEELGLRMLKLLAKQEMQGVGALQLGNVAELIKQRYSAHPEVVEATYEAWAWLNGQALLYEPSNLIGPTSIRKLSRQARILAAATDPVRSHSTRTLSKASLHPVIRDDVWGHYHRGKFDTAVFEALKAVEIRVREAGGYAVKDLGVSLMRKAFDPEKGPLTDFTAESSEREARAALFAGAIGSCKNPGSHRKVDLSEPDEAAEIIMLANHLLRIVDDRAGLKP